MQVAAAAWRNTQRTAHPTRSTPAALTAVTTTLRALAGCSVSKPWVCTTQTVCVCACACHNLQRQVSFSLFRMLMIIRRQWFAHRWQALWANDSASSWTTLGRSYEVMVFVFFTCCDNHHHHNRIRKHNLSLCRILQKSSRIRVKLSSGTVENV